MRRKIGILTFHSAKNYGAVLQTFATNKVLKELGHDVYIINYQPKYLTDRYKLFSIKRCASTNMMKMVAKIFLEIFHIPLRYFKYKNFKTFLEREFEFSEYSSKKKADFEVIIFGSDQIWSPIIGEGFDEVYFGNLNKRQETRLISYSASMGRSIKPSEQRFLRDHLSKFSNISVRENLLRDELVSFLEKPILKTIDPTLLLNKNEWSKLCKDPKVKKKYVLLYEVKSDINSYRIAKHIAKQIDAIVVRISSKVGLSFNVNTYNFQSPYDFLGLYKYAECVVTTSFHGTAFSVIFNKDFYTLKLGGNIDLRSTELLNDLSLQNRLIDKTSSPLFSSIDYTNANSKLKDLAFYSEKYLTESIK